jgi:hypothetical protein
MRISSTQLSAWKRLPKQVRNYFTDPTPRDKELVFEDYNLRFPEIEFIYSAGERKYRSVARIELPNDILCQLNKQDHHSLFVNLGLAFAASHFLLSDFATVRVACAALGKEEVEMLERMLANALSEFRYRQGLDPSRPVKITSSGARAMQALPFPRAEAKALMLNGGGKDTCVSAELLKHVGVKFSWLSAFPNTTRTGVVERSGVPENYSVRFHVSRDISQDAAYDWGVYPYLYPICATSLIVAYLTGSRYLVTGAEHSADDPNLIYNGFPVNHQSGKTFAFESFFNEFVRRAVLQDALLFSIARPFTDLRLSELFSHFPQYFDVFLSCNDGMGTERWCCKCHKCAFTYMALYPFVEKSRLDEIFGASLFDNSLIRRYMLELTAERSIKPWECVGTVEESRLALYWCLRRSPSMQFSEWPKRRDLESACSGVASREIFEDTMSVFHCPHNIPENIAGPLAHFAASLLEDSMDRGGARFAERSV